MLGRKTKSPISVLCKFKRPAEKTLIAHIKINAMCTSIQFFDLQNDAHVWFI